MVALGFLVLVRGVDPLNGFFISFIGWWLLGAARTERQLGQVRQSLDGVRMSEIMRPVGSAPGWITVRAFAERYVTRATRLGVDARALGRRLRRGAARRHRSAPFPSREWDLARPLDVAAPISATTGATPDEDALQVVNRTGTNQVILVVDAGQTIGAVLPADLEALVRVGRRGPVPSEGWTLTRG